MKKNFCELINLRKNDIVIIGCSTGPDSMALLDILVKCSKKIDFKVIVAHVNHNIRKASIKEENFLEKYCFSNNLIFEKMIITEYGDDNFHNEARNIRYRFFDDLVHKYGANYVMTAHHGDDLVETILMRLARGSTLSGYVGFRKEIKKDTYKIVRPFLNVSKEDIILYNKVNRVPYFTDKSNKKMKYTRNRYRKNILSFLKSENIDVHLKFVQYSEKMQKALSFLDKQTNVAYNKCYANNQLNLDVFNEFDPFIKEEVINIILEDVYEDDLILITQRHVDLILDLINSSKKNNYIYLPNDFIVKKEYNKIAFCLKQDEIFSYEIELSSSVELPNGFSLSMVSEFDDCSNNTTRLSSSDLLFPLIVRSRRFGDKMEVKNLNGTKKLKDIFIDSKVAVSKRDNWPIVTDSKGEIVFVPGIKKSKYDKTKNEDYDIVIKYCKTEEN